MLAPLRAEGLLSLNDYGFSCFHAFAQTVPFAQNISLMCLPGELSSPRHCLVNPLPMLPHQPQGFMGRELSPGAAVLAEMLAFGMGMRTEGRKLLLSECRKRFASVSQKANMRTPRSQAGPGKCQSCGLRVAPGSAPPLRLIFLLEGGGSVLSCSCVSGDWLIHVRCSGDVCGWNAVVTLPTLCCFEWL